MFVYLSIQQKSRKNRSITGNMIYWPTMKLEMTAPETVEKQRRRRLEFVLLASFILCLLVGLLALAALFLLRPDSPSSAPGSPLRLVQPNQIVPGLALKRLAGESAEPLAYQAINAGELETALALILYSPDTPSAARAVLYERLPRRYRDLSEESRAAQVLPLARSAAVLDPRLGAMERAQLLILSAEIFLATEDLENTLDVVQQAKRIGEQAPDLLPAQRAQIFERLRPLALAVDDPLLLQELGELLRNPRVEPPGAAMSTHLPTLGEPIDADPAVAAAVEARRAAAQALIDRLLQVAGSVDAADLDANIAPERQALAQALLNEDQVRRAYIADAVNGVTLGQQLTLLRGHRSWLALKVQVAQRGFGLSIVPEWENDPDSVLLELSAATNNIGTVLDGFLNSLDTGEANAALRVEKWLWLALQFELGLHPYADATQLNNELRFSQDELALQQNAPVALPVFYDTTLPVPGFRIRDTGQP